MAMTHARRAVLSIAARMSGDHWEVSSREEDVGMARNKASDRAIAHSRVYAQRQLESAQVVV